MKILNLKFQILSRRCGRIGSVSNFEDFPEMIEAESWTPICGRHERVGCIAAKKWGFADAIFTTKYHL